MIIDAIAQKYYLDLDYNLHANIFNYDCLVSLVVLSATATLEVLGLNPGSSKSVIELGFSMTF